VIALAAFAASLTVCLPVVGIPLVLAAALVGGGVELISGTLVAVLVSIIAYSAIFTAWGIRIRRALPWGLAYILLWEGFVAGAGRTASRLAIRSYSQSILSEYTGIGLRLAEFPLVVGIIVPLIVAGLALAYASHRLRVQDVD
jgi:ABC-2 type transport system permease protein